MYVIIAHLSGTHLLGLGTQISDLKELKLAVSRHLFNADFFRVLEVRRRFVRIRVYDPIGMHTISHYLLDFFLLQNIIHMYNESV